jgi:peptidoglycan-associated lipoprotein
MKTMTLIQPLALALAVTLAGAGCKHGAPRTTPLPPPPVAQPADTGNTTPINQNQNQQQPPQPIVLPPSTPITPEQTQVGSTNIPIGGLPTSDTWDPANMVADPAALAASTVHFAFDSAVVRMSEQVNVQAVAAYLASNLNDKLMVEGNCDERGTEEYNRSLGERRALALREALAKLNVDPQRVRTISWGKDKPVDPAHNEAAFAKNRRGDFVVYHPKPGA